MKKAERLQPMWSAEAVEGLTPEEKLVVALIGHACWVMSDPEAQAEPSGWDGLTAGEWARLWIEDESHEPWSLNWACLKLREAMGELDPDKIRINARR